MPSIDALRHRINNMLAKIEPVAKTWVLVLEVGQEIPEHIYWQIRPQDRIIIQEIPIGYLGLEKSEDTAA
jgi:hypothetical protein